ACKKCVDESHVLMSKKDRGTSNPGAAVTGREMNPSEPGSQTPELEVDLEKHLSDVEKTLLPFCLFS
ncbi:hypothetical protein AMECASPLE_039506, partial [Ameca splendens]